MNHKKTILGIFAVTYTIKPIIRVIMKKIAFLILFIGISGFSVILGQNGADIYNNPKYGADSAARMDCANHLSTMSEFMKINLYSYALSSWKIVFDVCPASSKNIYLYGVKIYREYLIKEKDPERKKRLVDTLMMVYDRRIENFGQEGLVIGRKGIDLLRYQQESIEEAYGYLGQSVELCKSNTEEAVLVTFMQTTNALFKMGKIEAQVVIDNYLVATDILEAILKKGPDERAQTALTNVETIFSESGAASCDDLVNIFTPKFEETPEDIEFLKKLTTLLSKQRCESTDLFASASESLYQVEPSSGAAYNLAKLFLVREEYQKAASYYKEAIGLEEDTDIKANLHYELALIEFTKFDQYSNSRSNALAAINLKSGWGAPYILIGNLYASSTKTCGENDFEKSCVFLVAVDKFIRARNVDESVAAEANELINKYSQYFPNVEDAFFYGFQEGQDYTVGCWINESTTLRTRTN
jgi:tetratricopeptide (TPR) repeat protein